MLYSKVTWLTPLGSIVECPTVCKVPWIWTHSPVQLRKVLLYVLRSLDVKVCALYWANAALEDIVVGGAVAANHSMTASITAKPTTVNALLHLSTRSCVS